MYSPSAVNRQRNSLEGKLHPQPLRKSPRLQEIHNSRQQRIAGAGKRIDPSPRTTKTHKRAEEEQPHAKCRVTRAFGQSECIVAPIILNANDRSRTTSSTQGQGLQILSDNEKGAKEWLVFLNMSIH